MKSKVQNDFGLFLIVLLFAILTIQQTCQRVPHTDSLLIADGQKVYQKIKRNVSGILMINRKLITVIMANTKGEGEKEQQDFWYKAEKLLYTALIAYIWYEGEEEEKNFSTLLDLLNESEVREEDEEYKNPVDLLFEDLKEKDPDHFAVRQYRKYKLSAGEDAKSILVVH